MTWPNCCVLWLLLASPYGRARCKFRGLLQTQLELSFFMHPLAQLDHRYVWHPFTQMRDWLKQEPIVISKGKGAVLQDVNGRQYLDANASIWTNLHGHNHPGINRA